MGKNDTKVPSDPPKVPSVARKIVVSRKKIAIKGKKLTKRPRPAAAATARGGLPTTIRKGLPTAQMNHPHVDESAQANQDEFGDAEFLDDAPTDTLLAVQALLAQADTSLAIPLQSHQQPPEIKGVLESQLYPILEGNDKGDVTVSRELQAALHSGRLCRLTAPLAARSSKAASLSVLLLTSDYQRAVHDAMDQHGGDGTIAAWFVQNVRDWTRTSRIPKADLQESYQKEYTGPHSFDQILIELQRAQVLLPQHSTETYQLWLPAWGLVLSAWERASRNLIAFLKRSRLQERSQQSLQKQDAYSPVSKALLLHWLIVQGRVQVVQRPYGPFVELVE